MRKILAVILVIMIAVMVTPLSAFAFDPVSFAAMSNGLAQALMTYGSSLGISFLFDVDSPDQIGNLMNEMWNDFTTTVVQGSIPQWANIAADVYSTLYVKVGDKVGIFIDDTVIPYFDRFFNWLCLDNLLHPADYFEWPQGVSRYNPIQLNTVAYGFTSQPIPRIGNISAQAIVDGGFLAFVDINGYSCYLASQSTGRYAFVVDYSTGTYDAVCCSDTPATIYLARVSSSGVVQSTYNTIPLSKRPSDPLYFQYAGGVSISTSYLPAYHTDADGFQAVQDIYNDDVRYASITLAPYIGETSPERVYIPDYTDVNYDPLPYTGTLDIPWDSTLYGDGSLPLDNAQQAAIEGDISQTIETDQTIALEGDLPMTPGIDTFNSVLPFVNLPSFNFSLANIWYYVIQWVSSLGAWLGKMFFVWMHLPYAISLPVYATAVVVVVVGVYKRFFM